MRPSIKSLVDRGVVLSEEIKKLTEEHDEIKSQIKGIIGTNPGSLEGKIGSVIASVSKGAERLDADKIKQKFGRDYLLENNLLKVGEPTVSLRFARRVEIIDVVQELPTSLIRGRKRG